MSHVVAVARIVEDPGGTIHSWLARLDVVSWVLIAAALAITWLTWRRVVGRARLGTIEVEPLKVDGETLQAAAAAAELQRALSSIGLAPSGAVPAGTPTANLAAAVAAAPVPQAPWFAAVIGVLPIPPSSTSFRVIGTLRADGPYLKPCGLTYEVVDLGSGGCVGMATEWAASPESAIRNAAIAIYMHIGKHAPDIFPAWARWDDPHALALYRRGLDAQELQSADTNAVYKSALELYQAASEREPDNMVVRLRIGNCLERLAGRAEMCSPDRLRLWIEALNVYVAVGLREPSIFEAGYRASVLLGFIADYPGKFDADADACMRAVVRKLAPGLQVQANLDGLRAAIRKCAARESRRARRRLRPLWTAVVERRLPNRLEPTEKTRRQLRKALAISRMGLKVRGQWHLEPADVPWGVPALRRVYWRGWVRWRHLALRWRTAGWQAHYNAAAFYALLPEARDRPLLSSARIRDRAFGHLQEAIRDRDHDLRCAYVREEDPDLDALRELDEKRWQSEIVTRLCGAEAILHYRRAAGDYDAWGAHVWGKALRRPGYSSWAAPLTPCGQDHYGAIFRIPLHDETKGVSVIMHNGSQKDGSQRRFVPVLNPDLEAWTRQGDDEVYYSIPDD